MSVSDPLMFRYYELLTDVPLSQIDDWRREIQEEKLNPKDLKSRLAKMIVADFWSEAEAAKAVKEFDLVFKQKEIPSDLAVHVVDPGKISESGEVSIIDVLEEILLSRGEAKRMVRQGGIYIDGSRIDSIELMLNFKKKNEYVLKIGKRRFYKIAG
jgi:tyrosyl-tRNA synthetase